MVLAVAILLLAGLLLRLPGLDTPSVEQRENQSSLLARGWYLGDGDGLPVWKQRVLDEVDTVLEPFEPPLLELAAAGFYRTTDGERIWFPRLLSALAWIVGAAILALIARRITNTAGLLTAVALYLVWPYAAWHSRKFMPDALMVSCLLAAVLADRPVLGATIASPTPRRLGCGGRCDRDQARRRIPHRDGGVRRARRVAAAAASRDPLRAPPALRRPRREPVARLRGHRPVRNGLHQP